MWKGAMKEAKRIVQEIMQGKVPPEKLVISKGCKPFNMYANPDSQPTVQTAKKLIASGFEFVPGMKVSWIVTNSRKTPQEVTPYVEGQKFEGTPDWRYYAERVAQTVSRVTEVWGLDEKSLIAWEHPVQPVQPAVQLHRGGQAQAARLQDRGQEDPEEAQPGRFHVSAAGENYKYAH